MEPIQNQNIGLKNKKMLRLKEFVDVLHNVGTSPEADAYLQQILDEKGSEMAEQKEYFVKTIQTFDSEQILTLFHKIYPEQEEPVLSFKEQYELLLLLFLHPTGQEMQKIARDFEHNGVGQIPVQNRATFLLYFSYLRHQSTEHTSHKDVHEVGLLKQTRKEILDHMDVFATAHKPELPLFVHLNLRDTAYFLAMVEHFAEGQGISLTPLRKEEIKREIETFLMTTYKQQSHQLEKAFRALYANNEQKMNEDMEREITFLFLDKKFSADLSNTPEMLTQQFQQAKANGYVFPHEAIWYVRNHYHPEARAQSMAKKKDGEQILFEEDEGQSLQDLNALSFFTFQAATLDDVDSGATNTLHISIHDRMPIRSENGTNVPFTGVKNATLPLVHPKIPQKVTTEGRPQDRPAGAPAPASSSHTTSTQKQTTQNTQKNPKKSLLSPKNWGAVGWAAFIMGTVGTAAFIS